MPPQPLTLKQRLAALSLVPSSPSSPFSPSVASPTGSTTPTLGSPVTPTMKSPMVMPKKRGSSLLFSPPWMKKSFQDAEAPYSAMERVRDVMSRVIFQAGVDYETRPMVVIAASELPDPREVSYDLLLSQILSYLDLFVESDYTVIFLAAGGRHSPGWNWVWKAYRSLSRKYRKNLKRLFIVHSTFFSKMLFSLAGAIISPKFFRKIAYLDTLSDLAYHVPLTQIDIPPAVYKENLKHEDYINLPTPFRSNMFGVPLEDIMGYDGEKDGLPRVVRDCIQFLRERGLDEEGLFRRSPNSVLLRQAQEAYDRGHTVSLHTFDDPHIAAVLLKKFLRDLPQPLVPESLYPVIRRCPPPSNDPSDISTILYIRETLLPELAPCSYILLSGILHLMHEISLRSDRNLMDAHNLTIVLCPNLISGSNPLRDVSICSVSGPTMSADAKSPFAQTEERGTTLGVVIKVCIQRYYEVFDEVFDRSEAIPPAMTDTSLSSLMSSQPTTDNGTDMMEPLQPPVPPFATGHRRIDSQDSEESIDDAMLVMPIGPSFPSGNGLHPSYAKLAAMQRNANFASTSGPSPSASTSSTSPIPSTSQAPIAWNTSHHAHSPQLSHKFRHRRVPSGSPGGRTPSIAQGSDIVGAQSMYTVTGGASGAWRSINGHTKNVGSISKAKSLFSIDSGSGGGGDATTGKRGKAGSGSVRFGQGTMRKSSGSGVAAMSVTAEGFFAPPTTSPRAAPTAASNAVPSVASITQSPSTQAGEADALLSTNTVREWEAGEG